MDFLKSTAKTFVSLDDRRAGSSKYNILPIEIAGVRKKDNMIFWGQLERQKRLRAKYWRRCL